MGYLSIPGNRLPSQALAADVKSLGQLKADAGKTSPESIRETAKQFESLFMRELMKSMREATMKSGMLDNAGSDLGTDLLDQQFAVQMSGQPGGLSDLIAQQLSRQSGVELEPKKQATGHSLNTALMSMLDASGSFDVSGTPMPTGVGATDVPSTVSLGAPSALSFPTATPFSAAGSAALSVESAGVVGANGSGSGSGSGSANASTNISASSSVAAQPVAPVTAPTGAPVAPRATPVAEGRNTVASERIAGTTSSRRPPTASQVHFVNKHSAAANRIERESGIPASYMLGQAGHETGWGKFEIKLKGGAPSHNLFGIKAGAGWTGKVAEVTTTEYVNGVAKKQVARFRAYDSYEDSFKDYARLISDSPRYAKVMEQTSSVHAFASGLQKAGYATDPDYASKLSRAINTTLQLRRVQV